MPTLTVDQAVQLGLGLAQPDVTETTPVAFCALTFVSHVEAGRLGLVLAPDSRLPAGFLMRSQRSGQHVLHPVEALRVRGLHNLRVGEALGRAHTRQSGVKRLRATWLEGSECSKNTRLDGVPFDGVLKLGVSSVGYALRGRDEVLVDMSLKD